MASLRALLCFFSCLVLATGVSLAQSQNASKIAATGDTVLTAKINGADVGVEFRSAQIKPGDPLHPAWESFENHTFTTLTDLKISVGGKPVSLQDRAFADLLDPHGATLRAEKGSFVVRIYGLDASEAYFLDVWSNKREVTRRRDYSSLDDVLASETRYFYHALKDRF